MNDCLLRKILINRDLRQFLLTSKQAKHQCEEATNKRTMESNKAKNLNSMRQFSQHLGVGISPKNLFSPKFYRQTPHKCSMQKCFSLKNLIICVICAFVANNLSFTIIMKTTIISQHSKQRLNSLLIGLLFSRILLLLSNILNFL